MVDPDCILWALIELFWFTFRQSAGGQWQRDDPLPGGDFPLPYTGHRLRHEASTHVVRRGIQVNYQSLCNEMMHWLCLYIRSEQIKMKGQFEHLHNKSGVTDECFVFV